MKCVLVNNNLNMCDISYNVNTVVGPTCVAENSLIVVGLFDKSGSTRRQVVFSASCYHFNGVTRRALLNMYRGIRTLYYMCILLYNAVIDEQRCSLVICHL